MHLNKNSGDPICKLDKKIDRIIKTIQKHNLYKSE